MADYLTMTFEDRTCTFFKDVYRLPPGTSLTVGQGEARSRVYRSLDPSSKLRLASDGEYAADFPKVDEREYIDEIVLDNADCISGYVDVDSLRAAYQQCRTGVNSEEDGRNFSIAVTLGLWLKKKDLSYLK